MQGWLSHLDNSPLPHLQAGEGLKPCSRGTGAGAIS